jgi:hypothetical protein
MSASRERRERQAQRASGIDTGKRIVKSRKAQKQDRLTRWVIGVFIGIIVFTLSALFLMGQGVPQRVLTAVEIGGERIRVNEFEYHYNMSVVNFVEEFGEMMQWFGFDPSQPHGAQMLDAENGYSWKDYFVDQAMNSLLDTVANSREAVGNGLALGDWEHFMIDDYIGQIRANASRNNMTMSRALADMFGRGTSESSLRATLERLVLADMWKEHIISTFDITEQHIAARYYSNPDEYDTASFHILQLSGNLHHDCDGDDHTHEHSEEDYEAAFEEARQRAEQMVSRATAANFYALALEHSDLADREWLEENPGSTLTPSFPIAELLNHGELGEWLADAARRPGDRTLISDETGHNVLLYVSRAGWPQTGVDVRHILFRFDDYEEDIAEERAADLLREWRTTGASEDNFASMAELFSGCGSSVNGGLFTDVLHGDMVPEFNDWIFAPARRPGDTDVVRTQFGYHIMYFVEKGETPLWPRQMDQQTGQWRNRIEDTLLMEEFGAYQEWLLTRFSAEPKNFGLRFVQ